MIAEHVCEKNVMSSLSGKAERKYHKSENSLTGNVYEFLVQDICTHYNVYI